MNTVLTRKPMRLSEAQAAQMLAALGSLPRLTVYRALLRAGADGLNISDVQAITEMPASTLKHHLTALVSAGLVAQTRDGREVYCTAQYQAIRTLADFLQRECCADEKRA